MHFHIQLLEPCVQLSHTLMVIGLISDDKWCGIRREQLNFLLNRREKKQLRSLQPAAKLFSHLSRLSDSLYGMLVCQEKYSALLPLQHQFNVSQKKKKEKKAGIAG